MKPLRKSGLCSAGKYGVKMAPSFEQLLAASVSAHGHLCPGQVLGVRMSMIGLALLGYEAPLDETNIKKVVAVVEIDRCATDAVSVTTGVKLGRRSLQFRDYGLMAATFVNLPDGRAFRVAAREDCRDKAAEMLPQIKDPHQREIQAYQLMPASDLFMAEAVTVDLKPEDLPGYHAGKVVCEKCGTMIRHRREVKKNGRVLCRVCAGGAYFKHIKPVFGIDALNPVESPGSKPPDG